MARMNCIEDSYVNFTHKNRRQDSMLQVLEAVFWETFENYLRVAPIRSGDSVTIAKSGFEFFVHNKQGGTAGETLVPRRRDASYYI